MLVLLVNSIDSPAIPASEQATASQMDSVFASLAVGRSPGLAVLVRRNGRTLFERGYGVRDQRTLAKIDSRTNFRLASFTKQFTAMATMLLVRDGKLRYTERLTDVFPEFPGYGRAITVRQLLTHTAGLLDYENLMEEAARTQGLTWTSIRQIKDEEVLRLLKQQITGKFEPGTSWAYSNSGYVMLGLIVAKASGEPFGQFLHDRIFAPLQMNETVAL